MNILLLGGNHNFSLHIIEKLLLLKKNFNIVIIDNNISRNQNYNNFCDVYKHYGYLDETNLKIIHENANNKIIIKNICKKYNINYIINNIKYNQKYSFQDNYNNLIHGYGNLLDYCYDKELNIIKVINIYRLITAKYYNLQYNKNRNIQNESRGFNDTQKCLNSFFDHKNKIVNVQYNDYIIGNDNICNNLIEKYIYMFKIGDVPYAHDTNIYFHHIDELIASIFVVLFFPDRNDKTYTLSTSTVYNIQNELVPSIINYINTTRQDNKVLNYHSQTNQKYDDIGKIIDNNIVKSIQYSINKIYE